MPEREQTSAAKPFWTTLPAILTSAATLLGAITALYVAYRPTAKKVEAPKVGAASNLAISTFEARPASVKPGQPATLFWRVEHADAIDISPDLGPVGAIGSRQVQPKGPTTFVLTATSGAQHQRATVAIAVAAPGLSEQVEGRFAKTTALPGDEIIGISLSRTDSTAGIFQVTYRILVPPSSEHASVPVLRRDNPAGVVFSFYQRSQGSFAPRFLRWPQDF